MTIDTHAHITKEFFDNIDEIISDSKENNIKKIIVPSVSLYKEEKNKYKDFLYFAQGLHPENVRENITKDDISNVVSKNTIAIGECGLDYLKGKNKRLQIEIFKMQIEIAKEKNLPVIIHSREALRDIFSILSYYYGKNSKNSGVIHSAYGDFKILNEITKLGFFLSFNGISTFKNAEDIREIIYKTDIKYILAETDSPFLSPEPLRGIFPNKPINIKYVIENIKKIKNNEDTEKILYENSLSLFKI